MSDGGKEYLIDITDEKTHGIVNETFDTPASLFFAKTPVHSAEHKGSYRIFADLIFRGCRAVPRKPRKFSTAKISKRTVCVIADTVYHAAHLCVCIPIQLPFPFFVFRFGMESFSLFLPT